MLGDIITALMHLDFIKSTPPTGFLFITHHNPIHPLYPFATNMEFQ